MHAILQTLRLPAFGRLAATYTLNELADWMATIALSVLVYDATHSAVATTALFVATKFLPALLVPALAARLDRLPGARVLGGLYLVETVCLVTLAVLAGAFWLPAILALALLDGTLAATARATTRAATVAVLEPQGRLREGNAALNVGFSVMCAGGPIVAAGLVALFNPAAVLAIAAALFALQAVLVSFARGLPASEAEEAPWRARLAEGFAYVRRDATLRTLLGAQAIVLVLLTMVTPIEIIYAKESLDAGDVGLGALLTSWGAGMVIGSAIFAHERHRPAVVLMALSTGAVAVGYLGMAVAPALLSACAASALGGIGNGVQWVSVVTALQEATEERFQGRVAGMLEAVLAAGPGAGFLLGGAITALVSPRAAFAVSGAGVLAVMVVAGTVLTRRRVTRVAPSVAPEGATP